MAQFQIIKIFPALKSYAGLVSDGFLLSQILLDMFCNSNQKARSVSSYIGKTFIRVLPHAYDLYRARSHRFSHQKFLHLCKSHSRFVLLCLGCNYTWWRSTACRHHYLKQKFGGRLILPQKLRSLSEYEVPTVTEV